MFVMLPEVENEILRVSMSFTGICATHWIETIERACLSQIVDITSLPLKVLSAKPRWAPIF